MLKIFDMEELFQDKLFRNDIQNSTSLKKDYSLLLKKLNLSAKKCLVVEDSIVGVASAKSNSIFCIAFNRNNDDEISKIADKNVQTFEELMILLK